MFRPVLVTPPALAPVTLAEAKAHLRVTHDEENPLIISLIDAAVSRLDGWSGILGRCLVTQRWRQHAWGWGSLRLPFPDVSNVVVTYRAGDGSELTVAEADYRLDMLLSGPHVVFGSDWSFPALLSGGAAPVSIEFDAGYGAPAAVPAALRQAILVHVQALYDRLPDAVWWPAYDGLLSGFRVVSV